MSFEQDAFGTNMGCKFAFLLFVCLSIQCVGESCFGSCDYKTIITKGQRKFIWPGFIHYTTSTLELRSNVIHRIDSKNGEKKASSLNQAEENRDQTNSEWEQTGVKRTRDGSSQVFHTGYGSMQSPPQGMLSYKDREQVRNFKYLKVGHKRTRRNVSPNPPTKARRIAPTPAITPLQQYQWMPYAQIAGTGTTHIWQQSHYPSAGDHNRMEEGNAQIGSTLSAELVQLSGQALRQGNMTWGNAMLNAPGDCSGGIRIEALDGDNETWSGLLALQLGPGSGNGSSGRGFTHGGPSSVV